MSSYRVRYETIEFDTLDIHVRALRDKQEFSDDEGEAERLTITSATWSLFGVLWPSSRFLAQIMHTYDIGGRRVLEVGCGLALASLVLASREADITATDYHPEAQSFLDENRALNQSGEIKYIRASWEDNGEDEELGQFDLIIGSEILYERDMMPDLVGFMNRHAAPTCEIMLIDPRRENRGRFSRLMRESGWTSSRTDVVSDPSAEDPYSGQLLHFLKDEQTTPSP